MYGHICNGYVGGRHLERLLTVSQDERGEELEVLLSDRMIACTGEPSWSTASTGTRPILSGQGCLSQMLRSAC